MLEHTTTDVIYSCCCYFLSSKKMLKTTKMITEPFLNTRNSNIYLSLSWIYHYIHIKRVETSFQKLVFDVSLPPSLPPSLHVCVCLDLMRGASVFCFHSYEMVFLSHHKRMLMNVSLIAVKLNRDINNKFIYMFCHFALAHTHTHVFIYA